MQIRIETGNREANQNKVSAFLDMHYTKSEYTTAIVLPEIWDVGYALSNKESVGDSEGVIAADFLGKLAKKYNVWFVGGSVLAKSERGYFNRALVINPNGELIATYDKVHLISIMDEDKHFQRGNKDCRFLIDNIKCGCVLCYDIRFCEWVRGYALNGTEVLFVSAEWPEPRIDHWRALLIARAIENQMYVVACNMTGTTEKYNFVGKSLVVDPWGKIIYEAGKEEEFAFFAINTEEVKKVRSFLPVLKERVPELYFNKI
ncbi:MAG: carbon-nitrogen family hydrolase [Synergistaceae bacterium]|nr:carbon-nitrogen family hydrolase [Synergistaceae bacterium]